MTALVAFSIFLVIGILILILGAIKRIIGIIILGGIDVLFAAMCVILSLL